MGNTTSTANPTPPTVSAGTPVEAPKVESITASTSAPTVTAPPPIVVSVPPDSPHSTAVSTSTAPSALSLLCPMRWLHGTGAKEGAYCPVKASTSSSEGTIDTASSTSSQPPSSSACPVKHSSSAPADVTTTAPVSACPVKHNSAAPAHTTASTAPAVPEPTSGCPVKGNGVTPYKNPNQYNVYSQKIDPTNQMPATANQLPAPDQAVPLPVERVQSSIPKGGTETTWVYPSPQMFWNALVRKQKTEGASEEDMETVVAVHNNMNESTWLQVMAWEALHAEPNPRPGTDPKLLRFLGRPHDLSPKAMIKTWFGHPEPFDRHDWVVDRGGREVRYVIDYYHDEAVVDEDQRPKHMHDFSSMRSIKVDVRPALDSPQALLDRLLVMPWKEFKGDTAYKGVPFFATMTAAQVQAKQVAELQQKWQSIKDKCGPVRASLAECDSEESCSVLALQLQRCTASVACPKVAAALDECVNQTPVDENKVNSSFRAVEKCLERFKIDSANLLKKP